MNQNKKTFSIKGMHCASCVGILERSLKKVDGVIEATVNLATEKATITYDSEKVTDEKIASTVSSVGYKALINEEIKTEDEEQKEKQKELRSLRTKVIVSLILGVLILWGSFPGLMKTAPMILQNFWVQFLLASPVQFWAGFASKNCTQKFCKI